MIVDIELNSNLLKTINSITINSNITNNSSSNLKTT